MPAHATAAAAAAAAVGGAQLQGRTFLDWEAKVEDGSAHWVWLAPWVLAALTKVFIMLFASVSVTIPPTAS